ncbi:MAG: aminotransferase class III-fold pyridoxal phosphate-dependent enzyme [Gemmatimonadota bacterium]
MPVESGADPHPPAEPDAGGVDARHAARLAEQHWNAAGRLTRLPADRDDNFLLLSATGARHVLKVAAAAEDLATLELENAALRHLRAAGPGERVPVPLPAADGRHVVMDPETGRAVRLLTWLPGTPLATARPRDAALLAAAGALVGEVDAGLAGFTHPGADRILAWDLARGAEEVAARLRHVEDPRRRALLEAVLERVAAEVAPAADQLRRSVIHADGNDHNLLVGPARPGTPRTVTGLVDFGDMLRTWVVAGPAVAAAYAALDTPDPLGAAAALVRGYHARHPLREAELAVLDALLRLRLAVSVSMAAERSAAGTAEPYHLVSQAGAWAALERLSAVPGAVAHAAFRYAAGLEPWPAGQRAATAVRQSKPVAVVDTPLADAPAAELGPGSVAAAEAGAALEPAAWHAVIAAPAVAPWGASRRLDAPEVAAQEGPDRISYRTRHLGADLFLPAGTPLRVPLEGVVRAVCTGPRGATLVLAHEVDGAAFHTRWTGLASASVAALREEARMRAGEPLGDVAYHGENGGWPPHVHVQLAATDPAGIPDTAAPDEWPWLAALCPDPAALLGLPPARPAEHDLSARRSALLGPNLSLSYARPLHIVRGRGAYLFDADAQPYLDCVNNVAHVGHEHPRVVAAIRRQAAVLNTNTRYLHPLLVEYAERLTATLPAPLEVVFLTCSGSEANELALRLARAHTGRRDVVVLDGAYHGNTSALVDMSPYKFAGPGGAGRAPWVHVAALPDPYRDPRGMDAFVSDVSRACRRAHAAGAGPAAFFAEPLPGCAGQVVPPAGYLRDAFAAARAAGAVCVADEVQVGFGRVGSHMWAFEADGAVPDIVTLGKPIGNGHPLGAVVCTRQVAASFANGMEYFNTFGGNPVSCAAGLAVLDVLEKEGLQASAAAVGGALLEGLRTLAERHPLIGDVRGRGLYLGVELVRERGTREPAAAEAAHLVERAREHGVLLSTDGPLHNVIKIKPPLVFGAAEADRLMGVLDALLGEDALRR